MNFRLTGTDYETLRDTALLSRIDPWAADTAEAHEPDWFENDPDRLDGWTERILQQAEVWQQHEYAEVMAATGWTADAGVAKYAHLNAQKSAIEAQQIRGLAELWEARIAEIYPPVTSKIKELVQRELASELAVALRTSDRTMMARLGDAISLTTWYPATLNALEAGDITSGHVWAIRSAGMVLEPHQLAHYEQTALALASGLTPRRLHIAARKIAAEMGEPSFEERHRTANEQRTVYIEDLDDGMARLTIEAKAALLSAVHDRLTRQAKAIRDNSHEVGILHGGEPDPRTYDQLRTDIALELLLTGEPTGAPHAAADGIRANISISIPALTLLGESTESAMLQQHGPIDLDTATRIARNTREWVRILTHPVTRVTITADIYRPPPKLRDLIHVRDGRCRFPTCNANPRRTDIDHVHGWADGGKTTPDNLACLCRSHHTLKTVGRWRVTATAPGELTWTSPHGITTTDRLTHPVQFG